MSENRDLPTDLGLLKIIERYLVLQLGAVRRQITSVGGTPSDARGGVSEVGRPRPAARAPEWLVQLGIDGERRPVVVHRGGCAAARRATVVPASRRDALEALAAGVESCYACRPDRELQVD